MKYNTKVVKILAINLIIHPWEINNLISHPCRVLFFHLGREAVKSLKATV